MIIFLSVLCVIFAIFSVAVVFIPYIALIFLGMDLMVVFLIPGLINNFAGRSIVPDNFIFDLILVLIYIIATLYLLVKNKKAYILVVSFVALLMYIGGIEDKTLPLWQMTAIYFVFIASRLALAGGLKLVSSKLMQQNNKLNINSDKE